VNIASANRRKIGKRQSCSPTLNHRAKYHKKQLRFCKLLALSAFLFYGCVSTGNTKNEYNKDSDGKTLERTHKSFGYRLVEAASVFSGHKQSWDRDAEDFKKYLLETDQTKRRVPPAKLNRKFTINRNNDTGTIKLYHFTKRKFSRRQSRYVFSRRRIRI
jgi:hypothetical protein